MIKYINFFGAILIASTFAACGSGGVKTESTDAKNVENAAYDKVYQVAVGGSLIDWEGYKPTGKHHGTINISSGELMVKDGNLVGGEFVIDMNSIVNLDLEDAESNTKLVGHLKSADFFEVETYPTAKFVITEVKVADSTQINLEKTKGKIVPTHTITGNLTLKATTKSISFNAMVNANEDNFEARTNQFFIDRSEWSVKYGSRKFFDNLKDKFINDEMGIGIKLVATPKTS
jgi:polyisoprenoid-binding protein YceI